MQAMIEEWAMYQSWDELNMNQQKLVSKHLGKAEYQQLHEHLIAIRNLDVKIAPSPALRERLLIHLQESPTPSKNWVHAKIPLWQAVAAVMLCWLGVYFFKPKPELYPKPQVVYVRDTLVQEKIIWKEKRIAIPQIVYLYRDTLKPQLSKGVSLEDAPELLELFTQAEK